MASSLIPECHVMSDLLTIREKGILLTLLEPQCKLIKTTVAQLLEAKDTQGESPGWRCAGCGVVCLIEDETLRSYFLRLYCVKRAKLLWEQEVYIPFKYTATHTFFHTFPADGHQIGFNFANEIEAEEFYLVVKAVQEKQEKMTDITTMTNTEIADSSACDPPDPGMKPEEHLEHLPVDAPSITVTPATSSARQNVKLSEEGLQDEDITKSVDRLIKKFGGPTAVQRDWRNKGLVSCTLPRSAGGAISIALKKGPLPPLPSVKGNATSQLTPQCTEDIDQSQIPPPPSVPAPVVPERIRKSASFRYY